MDEETLRKVLSSVRGQRDAAIAALEGHRPIVLPELPYPGAEERDVEAGTRLLRALEKADGEQGSCSTCRSKSPRTRGWRDIHLGIAGPWRIGGSRTTYTERCSDPFHGEGEG